LEERVRLRQVVVGHEIRHAGVDGGAEEAGGEAGHSGERDDRDRLVREREQREDDGSGEVGADHQPPARDPVDERPEQQADREHGQELDDQERRDPLPRAGAVPDVDRQRDRGDAGAEPRAERRKPQQREARRPPQERRLPADYA
jgi:hypothetical protein